jgi:hypothetical protein
MTTERLFKGFEKICNFHVPLRVLDESASTFPEQLPRLN